MHELNHQTEFAAKQIVDAAFKVHSNLGPGLLESVYEVCLEYELKQRDLQVKRQVALPIIYDNVRLDAGYRIDLLVDNRIVIEMKAVDALLPIHDAQLLTYLKLSKKNLGFLINFNVPLIKDGIKRKILTN